MKVTLTWEFTDRMRRIVNDRVGRKGLATKEDCQRFMDGLLTGDWESIQHDYDEAQDEWQRIQTEEDESGYDGP